MNALNQLEIKKNRDSFTVPIVLTVLLTVIIVSLSVNITKPRLWVDEGKTVELARNFMNYRILDIQTAPDKFSKIAPVLQSTGYPVSVSLAFFFNAFGLGPHQARVFMLAWTILTLIVAFLIYKKFFSQTEALFSFLLIASFASFYDSGRTVVGEIPGFLFLLIGLYFWLQKDDFYKTGLFWGLAIVTKPSVYGLIIPTIVLTLLGKNLDFVKKILKTGIGMIPAAVIWFLLVVGTPSTDAMREIIDFYKNPYSSDISSNIINNITRLPFSTTIIYFSGLFVMILVAFYFVRNTNDNLKSYYKFVIIYSILAFIYYLRSPGWLRYILVSELLILLTLPNAIKTLLNKIRMVEISNRKAQLFTIVIILLVTIQTVQMFTVADIYYSEEVPRIISYVNNELPNYSVGTIGVIEASAFLKTSERYTMLNLTGMPRIGSDVLKEDKKPEILVVKAIELEDPSIFRDVDENYSIIKTIGRYKIYKNKKL